MAHRRTRDTAPELEGICVSRLLVVEYVERAPGPEDIVMQALTSPFHIVTLPRYNGPIRFRKAAAGSSVP